ncbi:DUF6261 family protein [Flavobacterium sp. SM2513]|uniref:DUF6261 family protein n=1 Tax=Flavobacterium sp. SM2513 TaxID=3424766 RepID=UPI003D7F9E28
MKLYPIPVSRLQILESGQFITNLITDYIKSGLKPVTDAEYNKQYEALTTLSTPYNDALNQIKAQKETEELMNLDTLRDQSLSTIRRAVSVFEFSRDPAEVSAYKEVVIILRKYGDIERANYPAETLGIDKVVAEIRGAKDDPMAVLQLKNHVDLLEQDNTAFKAKFADRSSDVISTVSYDVKTMRKEIFEVYTTLADYVALMAKIKNDPYFLDTLKVFNYSREYFADILARREGINKKNRANS